MEGWLAFFASITTLALIYGLLGLSLNVQYGEAGLINFGVVAFFAAGAFTSALVTLPPPGSVAYRGGYEIGLGMPFPVGVLAGGLVAALLSLLIGATSVRLRGDHLAIATFALAEIFHTFLSNEDWLTRGQFGISTVPQPLKGTVVPVDAYLYAYLIVAGLVVVITYLLIRRMSASPFGRVLRGIREDEHVARSVGKPATIIKLKAFVIGGFVAGVAGSLWVHWIGGVHVGQFVPIITFQVWLAVLLGGVGNHAGVLLGSVLLVAVREGTRFLGGIPGISEWAATRPSFLPSLRFVLIGFLLVVVVRVAPDGVLPERIRRRIAPVNDAPT